MLPSISIILSILLLSSINLSTNCQSLGGVVGDAGDTFHDSILACIVSKLFPGLLHIADGESVLKLPLGWPFTVNGGLGAGLLPRLPVLANRRAGSGIPKPLPELSSIAEGGSNSVVSELSSSRAEN
ncbi:hypothetical protein BLA29_003881 [Euroglyphus maynei]|uniref:Secreted protein n=1 Tax=Euroglyphus maynei TaxID=6958 RepID=A0A1Y3ATE8_EURMA|nr:hypothetical protein BLA29_003881 [Euroglyphus maynei]